MEEHGRTVVELLPPRKSGELSLHIFNRGLLIMGLSVKVDLEYFKHYKLHYIFEKNTNHILGVNKKLDTSALINSSPEDVKEFLSANNNKSMLIDRDIVRKSSLSWFDNDDTVCSSVLDIPGAVSEERLSLDYINVDNGISLTAKLDPVQTNLVSLPFFNIDLKRPWIDIPRELLNTEIGPHIYVARLQNKYTEDIVLAPFGYCIQDDKPNKPYIYMNRDK